MKTVRSLGRVLTVAVALSSTAAAWPNWLPEIDALVVRQADSSTTTKASATTTADATSETTTAQSTDANNVQTTNMNTAGITAAATGTDGTNTGTKTTGTGKTTGHTTFGAEDQAGGITMISPATTSGTQLYKIGDQISWTWNYTSLQATPTAIDILASCSTATATWTLTQNMTYEATGTYTWDTGKYKQTAVDNQLLTAMYTLIVYDAESSVSATAEPGYLSTYSGFTFGMYEPKAYTPLGDWKCAACSSAGISDLDRQALGFSLTMSIITVLSFTWFVAGFGVLL